MSSYSTAVLADGAVGYWRLGDATPTYGPELVVNGDFSVNTAGWGHDMGANGSLTSVAGGQSGNCLSLNALTGVVGPTYDAYPSGAATPVTIGQTYRLQAWVKSGTSGNEPFQFLPIGYPEVLGNPAGTSSAVWTLYTQYYVATTTTVRLVVVKKPATIGSMLFDEISMRLVTFPVALDAVAVPHNGAYSGGVELGQAGAVFGDTAGLFDGSSGNIALPNIPAANPGFGSYSFEAWVKRAAGITASEFALQNHSFTGSGGGGELFITSGGSFTSRLGAKAVVSLTGFADGAWHHVCMVMNRAIVSGGQCYVDGAASGNVVSLTSEAAVNFDGSDGAGVLIGKRLTGNFFRGSLDEVAIYPTALTPAQIANHYALAPVTFNPVWFEGSNAYVSVAP